MFNISTTNCSLGIFAKSLDGLPRAWVRIPPTPPSMAIGSRRNPRAFLGCPPKVVVCALTFVWLGFNRFCGFATAKVVVRL